MIAAGVTGVGGGVGQAVLRSMEQGRFQWRTVGMDTRALAPGLYWCDRGYRVPPVHQEEAYVQKLCSIVEDEHLDVLIPGLDVELEPLARHRAAFEERGCAVVVASEDAVRLSYDKYALHAFCRERDLPFVPTYLVDEAVERLDAASFPVIAKPRRGKASTGVRLISDRGALEALPRGDDLIIQDYLPPPSQEAPSSGSLDQIDEWSVQFFVDSGGDILGHFVSVNELKEGIPWEIVPRPNPEVVAEARTIVEALSKKGLHGPVNVQGRETEDGVKFFEVNARFTGLTGLRASVGYLELDAAIHAFLNGRTEKAKSSLVFESGYVGTGHVDYTTLSKTDVKAAPDASSDPSEAESSSESRTGLGAVLVTGASGYIGAEVLRHLAESGEASRVYAGVRDRGQGEKLCGSLDCSDEVQVMCGRLPDQPWSLEDVDTVVHLAAVRPSHDKPGSRCFEVNVEGTRQLLKEADRGHVRRIAFVSSQAVYGTRRQPPWSEMMTPQPSTPYGLSKWIGEQICSTLASSVETVALRVAQVYGRGAHVTRWSNFPHIFAKQIREESMLKVYGDGTQRMDLVHLEDVCRAIKNACAVELPSEGHTEFNIGGGNPISVGALASIFQEKAIEMGLPEPTIQYNNGQGTEWADFGMDTQRARVHLGWAPSVAPGEAAEELLRTYRRKMC
jgi:nucleoside-diphosphate-sugar epimerase/predicted ATP-grasp superfamily ATP-dependent carboligase